MSALTLLLLSFNLVFVKWSVIWNVGRFRVIWTIIIGARWRINVLSRLRLFAIHFPHKRKSHFLIFFAIYFFLKFRQFLKTLTKTNCKGVEFELKVASNHVIFSLKGSHFSIICTLRLTLAFSNVFSPLPQPSKHRMKLKYEIHLHKRVEIPSESNFFLKKKTI